MVNFLLGHLPKIALNVDKPADDKRDDTKEAQVTFLVALFTLRKPVFLRNSRQHCEMSLRGELKPP